MAFVSYVAGVAIANLLIGFVLGSILNKQRILPDFDFQTLAADEEVADPKPVAVVEMEASASDERNSY